MVDPLDDTTVDSTKENLEMEAETTDIVVPSSESAPKNTADHDVDGSLGNDKNSNSQPIPGDANVDGIFDSSDLVEMFKAGEYEDDKVGNSTWEEGDFNGDGEFDSKDILFAFQKGNYGKQNVADNIKQDAQNVDPTLTVETNIEDGVLNGRRLRFSASHDVNDGSIRWEIYRAGEDEPVTSGTGSSGQHNFNRGTYELVVQVVRNDTVVTEETIEFEVR